DPERRLIANEKRPVGSLPPSKSPPARGPKTSCRGCPQPALGLRAGALTHLTVSQTGTGVHRESHVLDAKPELIVQPHTAKPGSPRRPLYAMEHHSELNNAIPVNPL